MHNYTIKINGVWVSPSRFTLKDQFSQKSTGSLLIIYRDDETYDIEQYHPIEVYIDAVLEFAGVINHVYEDARSTKSGVHRLNVDFEDNTFYASILFTRIAFNNLSVGDAVRKIIEERIQPDYPAITIGTIDAYTQNVKKLTANFEKCEATLDKLAQNTNSYWKIDKNMESSFRKKSSLNNIGAIDKIFIDTEAFEKKVNRLRTRQYLKGGLAETDEQTREKQGDGTNQVFNVDFPISSKPQLFISNSLPALPGDEVDPAIIGIRGIDDNTPGIEWLFAFNSEQLSQVLSETPLTSGQFLTIVFIGLFEIAQVNNDLSQQSVIAAKIGGSGVIEAMDVDKTIRSIDDADQKNSALLADYANPEFKLPLTSKRDIMNVGDLFAYPDYPNLEFLCQTKTTVLVDCELKNITYTAYEGSFYGGWIKYFQLKANTGDFIISDNEKITSVENVNETTNWEEDIDGSLQLGLFTKLAANPYNETLDLYVVSGSNIPIYTR